MPGQKRVSVVHTGHGRRDGTDDRIVAVVGALADPAMALVYTSDARLRARVGGARALLDEIAAVRDATGPSASDEVMLPRGPPEDPS